MLDFRVAIKLREIRLNVPALIQIGAFMTMHPGHHVELRGDEYNYDLGFDRDLDYEKVTIVGMLLDDDDLRGSIGYLFRKPR